MSGKITIISDDEFSSHAPEHFIFLEAFLCNQNDMFHELKTSFLLATFHSAQRIHGGH